MSQQPDGIDEVKYWKQAYEDMAAIVDQKNREIANLAPVSDEVREALRALLNLWWTRHGPTPTYKTVKNWLDGLKSTK